MTGTPIISHLTGMDTAKALGVTAQGVIALARKLIDAGHDPTAPLEAYRGATLCLRIRAIGEAARLRLGSHGVGFEAAKACGAAPDIEPEANGPGLFHQKNSQRLAPQRMRQHERRHRS